jgi:hypothetical protein
LACTARISSVTAESTKTVKGSKWVSAELTHCEARQDVKFSHMKPRIQITHQNSAVEMDDKRSRYRKITHILQKVWSQSEFVPYTRKHTSAQWKKISVLCT